MFSILLHNVSNYRLSYFVTTPQKKCVLCSTSITYTSYLSLTAYTSQPTPILNTYVLYLFTIYSVFILLCTKEMRNDLYYFMSCCIFALVLQYYSTTPFSAKYLLTKICSSQISSQTTVFFCFLTKQVQLTYVSNCSFKVSKDWKG